MTRLSPAEVAAINAANAALKAARAQERAAHAEEERALLAAKAVTMIKGDNGEVGPQGPAGPKGASITGPRGEQGPKGATGSGGPVGPKGPDGDTGPKGDDGVGPDERVKAAIDDPVAGFLEDKLEAGDGIRIRRRKSKTGHTLLINAMGQAAASSGAGGSSGLIVYDDGVSVGVGNKVSYDGGDPVTISGGIIHVPVGSGAGGADDQTAAEVPFTPAGGIAATDVQAAIEEVAAEAGGSGVPIATPSVAVIDTTTYDNPIGPGKIDTLVLSGGDGVAFAVALDGDAFPRWLMIGDASDGLYFGDGTADPYNGGVAIAFGGTLAGTHYLLLEGPSSNVQVGVTDANAGAVTGFGGAVELIGSSGQVIVSGDVGAPTKGGNVGDLFLRQDGSSNDEIIYRCTVAGTAGNATWVALALGGLAGSPQTYTESNVTTDRAFNANSTTLDEIADVLGSLIVDLRSRGVVA